MNALLGHDKVIKLLDDEIQTRKHSLKTYKEDGQEDREWFRSTECELKLLLRLKQELKRHRKYSL